jgi:hypothetical protein
MILLPAVTPVTVAAVPAPTMDKLVLLTLQAPPADESVITTGVPVHKVAGPSIWAGATLTVKVVTEYQAPVEYVMVVVPEYMALDVTTPVAATTEAIRALLLLHVPPVVLLDSVIELRWHKLPTPVIGDAAPMFTVVAAIQPEGMV